MNYYAQFLRENNILVLSIDRISTGEYVDVGIQKIFPVYQKEPIYIPVNVFFMDGNYHYKRLDLFSTTDPEEAIKKLDEYSIIITSDKETVLYNLINMKENENN